MSTCKHFNASSTSLRKLFVSDAEFYFNNLQMVAKLNILLLSEKQQHKTKKNYFYKKIIDNVIENTQYFMKSLPISWSTLTRRQLFNNSAQLMQQRCYVIKIQCLPNPIISLILGKDTETGARHKKKS